MEGGISSRDLVSRRRWLPVIGLTGLGLALRIVGLRAKAYWTDEVATVDLVRGGVGHAMSDLAHVENTPPLYYVLAWPWAHLFGTSEVGLRSLSTVFSVALIPIAYLIGEQLVGSRVGLVAAALVATNPMLVWYGQDARAYALLSLLTGVSFLLFLRALDTPTSGRLFAWGVCCGLAIATHYFAVFLVAVEAAVLLWKSSRRALVVAASAIPVVTALGLVPLKFTQESQNADWISEMSLAGRVIKAPAVFIIGFESPAPHAVTALAALICAAGVWLLVFRAASEIRRQGLLALGIGAAAFALALLGAHYFLYRNVIGAVVPILAGLACGFGAARAGRLGPALAAALCLLSVGVVLATAHTPKFGKDDWRNAAAVVERGGGDKAIVATPSGSRTPLSYYLGGRQALFEGPGLRVAEIAVVAGADRPPGSGVTVARPPRRATPPAPAGFVLEGRDEHRYFTVITYRAPSRRWVSRGALEALALGREPRIIAVRTKDA